MSNIRYFLRHHITVAITISILLITLIISNFMNGSLISKIVIVVILMWVPTKKCTMKVPYVWQVIALYLLVKSCIGYDDGLIQSETCSQPSRKTVCCALTDDFSFSCIAKIVMIHDDILNIDLHPCRVDIHCHWLQWVLALGYTVVLKINRAQFYVAVYEPSLWSL